MKIQTKMYNLGSWGCLLFCYLKMINKDPFTAYTDFDDLVYKKIIAEDCTVLDADKLLRYYDVRDKHVEKANKNPGTTCIAKFSYMNKNGNTYGHWVIVDKDNNIIFNTLDKSNCVEQGKITDYRIIKS